MMMYDTNQNLYHQQVNNYGGYPQGYPPNVFQNMNNMFGQPQQPVWPNNQQFQPYTPGMVSQPTVETINAGYNPGGVISNQSGFNPFDGTTRISQSNTGFNLLADNPCPTPTGYYASNTPTVNPYLAQMAIYGYNGFARNPYGAPVNQFNVEEVLNNVLYQDPTYGQFDANAYLSNLILTDEEKKKINRTPSIIARDYYGNPIYGTSAYEQNRIMQESMEKVRQSEISHYDMLSRICHKYLGDEDKVDRDKLRTKFDPAPQMSGKQTKVFNMYSATPEELKKYYAQQEIDMANELFNRMKMFENYLPTIDSMRSAAFDKIKASHDSLIGVNSGEHYDLATYLDNAYKLGINIEMEKVKSLNRNSSGKYNSNNFRSGLAARSNNPVPINSKDNEYVTAEEILKRVYEKNRSSIFVGNSYTGKAIDMNASPQAGDCLMIDSNRGVSISAPSDSAEEKLHLGYLQSVQSKKIKDDARKVVS